MHFELPNGQAGPAVARKHSDKAKVIVAARGRERAYLLYQNTIPLSRNSRSLLILLAPAKAGSVDIRSRLLVDETRR